MPSTLIVSVIAGLIVLSIAISAISYNRQQALAKRKRKIQKHRDNADEMLAYANLLAETDPHFELLSLVQAQAVAELKSAHELMSEEPSLEKRYKNEKALLNKYRDNQRPNQVSGYLSSDKALNKARQQLLQLKKLLDIFNNRHLISSAKKAQLNEHIGRLTLNLEINSHLHQAQQYGEQNDKVMYQLHIKHARDTLKKSSINVDDKNQRIKQLTSILNEVKTTHAIVDPELLLQNRL